MLDTQGAIETEEYAGSEINSSLIDGEKDLPLSVLRDTLSRSRFLNCSLLNECDAVVNAMLVQTHTWASWAIGFQIK
jgi:hypothetical protein